MGMTRKHIIFFLLFSIVVISLAYFNIIGKNTALGFFGLGLLFYLSSIAHKVDSVLEDLGIDMAENDIRKILPVSYKLDISIFVNWNGIARTYFPEIENNNAKPSLEHQASFFDFTVFRDGISGLEQIWSKHHNSFVNEILVRGKVSDYSTFSFNDKFKGNALSNKIFITPVYIAFEPAFADGLIRLSDSRPKEKDMISNIPFWDVFHEIVNFHRTKKSTDGTLEISKNLKKEMQRLSVTFDKEESAYSLKGTLHEVHFSIHFFGP